MEVSGKLHGLDAGRGNPVPIEQYAGWAPEPIWTFGRKDQCLDTTRNRNQDPLVVHPVA
jgi:hypothetical protein